jgi:hypothetical protein
LSRDYRPPRENTASAQFSVALAIPVADQRAIHAACEEVLEPVLEAILEEEGLDGHDLLPLLDIEPAWAPHPG